MAGNKSIGNLSFQLSANADSLLGALNQVGKALNQLNALFGKMNESAASTAPGVEKAAVAMGKLEAQTVKARTGWEKFVEIRKRTERDVANAAASLAAPPPELRRSAAAQMAENRKALGGMPFVGPVSRGVSMTGSASAQATAAGAARGRSYDTFPWALPPTAHEQANKTSGRGLPLLLSQARDAATVSGAPAGLFSQSTALFGKQMSESARKLQQTAKTAWGQTHDEMANILKQGPALVRAHARKLAESMNQEMAKSLKPTMMGRFMGGAGEFAGGVMPSALAGAGLGHVAGANGPSAIMAGIGISAVETGADFEKAMARVKALTNTTGDEFKSLKDEALRLGTVTEFSSVRAAEGMMKLAQAGYKTQQIMASLAPTMRMATAGNISLEQAADLVTSAQLEFRMGMGDFGKIADVFSYATSNAKTTMDQLGDALKFAAPTARTAGLSLEETTAAIMMLSQAGIRGTEAGTMLRNMLKKTADVSAEAREMMELYGITFQDSVTGKFIGFERTFNLIQSKVSGYGEQAVNEFIGKVFELRAGSGFGALMDKGKAYGKLLDDIKEKSGGTSERFQATMLDTTWGRWQQMTASVSNTLKRLFEGAKPFIDMLIEGFNSAFKIINEGLSGIGPLAQAAASAISEIASIAGTAADVVAQVVTFGQAGSFKEMAEGAKELVKAGGKGIGMFFSNVKRDIGSIPRRIAVKQRADKATAEGRDLGMEDLEKSKPDAGRSDKTGLWKHLNPLNWFSKLKQVVETKAVQFQPVLDFNKAMHEATNNMNKHAGAAKEARESAEALFRIEKSGGSNIARQWHETIQVTKEYGGMLADLEKKLAAAEKSGAGEQVVGPLREKMAEVRRMIDQTRADDFNRRLVDEAAKVVIDARSPMQEFNTLLRDRQELLRRGFITNREYADSVRKIAESAAGKAGITELLSPWEQFNMKLGETIRQFREGILNAQFFERAIYKAAEAYDSTSDKGMTSALTRGSSEAISAVNNAFREKPGEQLARQIIQQQLDEARRNGQQNDVLIQQNRQMADMLARILGIGGQQQLPR